ncbi:MAG: FHA domain-containing protein [Solirubrobacterales bacterium]|nr:FHA domain-containing protein [Solirubrobacterales bacterium]
MAGEQLRVTEGTRRGSVLSVEDELLIGRESAAEAGRLGGDRAISRRHARISRAPDGALQIEDLGSANGTFVNHGRVDGVRRLAVGDLIRVGKTALEVIPVPVSAAVPAPPPAQSAARAILIITGGAARDAQLEVDDELIVGRSASGEGQLSDDPELSRRHARFARDAGGRLVVEDLGSANGTFVNGERVRGRHSLRVGDVIRVGATTLRVSVAGQAPAALAGEREPNARPPSPAPASPNRPPAPVAAERSPAPPAPAPARQPERPRRARPAPAPERPLPSPEVAPGALMAGCRVDAVIGHGDMGIVYRAEELALRRPVALKLILPEYSGDERFRERFRRESRIAAAIDHQNVIPIFDAGDEDGVLYIIMRLVEGTDLRALISADGPLEPLRAARIVRQVGAALDAAHARGMLHRDVKPSNVLLARRDHVYLSDFGLAKPAATEGDLTRHRTVVARAEYVAPEQVLGERVDARADIYALGCLLFEALTGEPPFSGWHGGPAALAHVDAPAPSPLELRPDLPSGFSEVVQRAMAKDPRERYPSAGDLGQAALVAAGGLRRAGRWSMVATGEAAPVADDAPAERAAPEPEPRAEPAAAPAPVGARRGVAHAPEAPAPAPALASATAAARRRDRVRWAIALAALLLVAIAMFGALKGISSL